MLKSMILIITITLSNGGTVIYEMDKSVFTSRTQFTDSEGIYHDWIMVYHIDSSLVHHITKELNKTKYYSENISKNKVNWPYEDYFRESLDSFTLDGLQGLKLIHEISPGILTAQYYIGIEELKDLYSSDLIINILPIIDDYYILAFKDANSIGIDSIIKPIKVEVKWNKSFSNSIEDVFKVYKITN